MKPLDQVLDIGPKFGAQFERAGVRTLKDLANARDLQNLSVRSEIPVEKIEQWHHQAVRRINLARHRVTISIVIAVVAAAALLLMSTVYLINPERVTTEAANLADKGDYDDALKLYQWVIEKYPRHELAYANAAGALYTVGRYNDALKYVNEALDLDPEDAWALGKRGDIYVGLQQYQLALASYNESIEINPFYSFSFAGRGLALRRLGQDQQALDSLTEAIKVNPKYAWAYGERGSIYHDDLFQYEPAYADLKQAYALDSQDYGPDLAEAELTLGHFDEAYATATDLLADQKQDGVTATLAIILRFMQITALLLENKRAQAKPQLTEFFDSYQKVASIYDHNWNFAGTKNFIEHQKMNESQKELVLAMIDFLANPPSGTLGKLEKLAAAVN